MFVGYVQNTNYIIQNTTSKTTNITNNTSHSKTEKLRRPLTVIARKHFVPNSKRLEKNKQLTKEFQSRAARPIKSRSRLISNLKQRGADRIPIERRHRRIVQPFVSKARSIAILRLPIKIIIRACVYEIKAAPAVG